MGSSSEIEVTYTYTSNGIIEVTAKQKENQKILKIEKHDVPDDISWTDLDPKDYMKSKVTTSEVEVILCIDLSGSMYFDNRQPIIKATQAMLDFVSQMDSSQVKIGLLAFADKHKMISVPTSNYKALKEAISNVQSICVGDCNEDQPFTEGYNYFRNSDADIKYLIVLTDGIWDNQNQAINEAHKCHKNGIDVIALGFGTADEAFLKEIASSDDFASLTNLNELSTSFTKIAQEIGGDKLQTWN